MEAPFELVAPQLTWRPRGWVLWLAMGAAVLTACAFIPWWTDEPRLGVVLLVAAAVSVLAIGTVLPRQTAVLQAHAVNRGGSGFDPVAILMVSSVSITPLLTVIMATVWSMFVPQDDVAFIVALVVVGAVLSVSAWAPSQRHRASVYLAAAIWAPRHRRAELMLRALELDPGALRSPGSVQQRHRAERQKVD